MNESCYRFALHRHVRPIWITNLRHLLVAQTHWYRSIMSRMTIIGSRPPRLEWQATLKRDTALVGDVNKMSMVGCRRENWAIKRLKSLEEVLVGSETVVENLLKLPSGRRTLLRRAFAVPRGAHEALQLTNLSTPVVRMSVKTLVTTNDELLATNLNKS